LALSAPCGARARLWDCAGPRCPANRITRGARSTNCNRLLQLAVNHQLICCAGERRRRSKHARRRGYVGLGVGLKSSIKNLTLKSIYYSNGGGEEGIRTPDTVLTV